MGDISATFTNNYGESRRYMIVDMGRDQYNPPVIFDDYLDRDQTTDWLTLHDEGRVMYQRSDGPQQVEDNIRDGDNVRMS